MSIPLQLKNFAKLLLAGAVLFAGASALSHQAARSVSAKNQKDANCVEAHDMFARAAEQARPESPEYLLAGDGCVKAAVPPVAATSRVLAAIVGDFSDSPAPEETRNAIVEYEVTGDETLAGLAEKFNVNVETIAWANDLSKNASLKTGQKLIIPPVSGVIHYAAAGDTLAQIAKKYQAQPEEIVAFNELAGENDVFIGDVLMVPGGKIIPPAPKALTSSKTAPAPATTASGLAAMPADYFLCPVGSACKRTQGLHFRNAVDLTGGYCGAPIYAAASGTVIKAKIGGWNGGAGNNITISHMGGTVTTHYYHLQSVAVASGQEVKKGDVIGTMGKTGQATGCHLHFEVGGAKNPF